MKIDMYPPSARGQRDTQRNKDNTSHTYKHAHDDWKRPKQNIRNGDSHKQLKLIENEDKQTHTIQSTKYPNVNARAHTQELSKKIIFTLFYFSALTLFHIAIRLTPNALAKDILQATGRE